jgi:hypothetical protein
MCNIFEIFSMNVIQLIQLFKDEIKPRKKDQQLISSKNEISLK